ncbi:MAG TPA: HRDC domain-containing protein [Myxococcaceae bacterium]|nr:HRDC domain-containing protein [Myxococcaceae bacterium]
MAPFSQPIHDVTDPVGAAAVVRALEPERLFAVDLEADAMHAFRARLCFLQIGTDQDIWLVDTLAPGVEAAAVAALFADPLRTKVFHAAQGDLQFLAEAGVRVRGLFDTHRAATLLGWPKVGLADLAAERLGVTLDKGHQQSDFSIRPLPPEMHRYIADDVRYLTELGRQVIAAVVAADIVEEVQLDCERLTDEAAARPSVAPFAMKIPRTLPPAEQAFQLAASTRLHALRLAWAEAADLPMGRMLSNAAIQELVTRPPKDRKALSRTPGVRGQVVREHGDEVVQLLSGLRAAAERGELPVPVAPTRDPGRRRREEDLKTFRAAKALERGVTPSVVLPNPLVEQLAAAPPANLNALSRVPYLGDKRILLYGEALLSVLAGGP